MSSYDFKIKIQSIYVILKKFIFLRYRVSGDKKIFSAIIHKKSKLSFYGQLIVLWYKINNSFNSKHLICQIWKIQNFQFNARSQFFSNNQQFEKKFIVKVISVINNIKILIRLSYVFYYIIKTIFITLTFGTRAWKIRFLLLNKLLTKSS